jgi:hypothetical protein
MILKKIIPIPANQILADKNLSIDQIKDIVTTNKNRYPNLVVQQILLAINCRYISVLIIGENHFDNSPDTISLTNAILPSFGLVAFESLGLFKATGMQTRYKNDSSPMKLAERKYYKQEIAGESDFSFHLLPLEQRNSSELIYPVYLDFGETIYSSNELSDSTDISDDSDYQFQAEREEEMASNFISYLTNSEVTKALVLVGEYHIRGLLANLTPVSVPAL